MVVFIVNTSMKLDKYLLVFRVDKYEEHMELKGNHRKSATVSRGWGNLHSKQLRMPAWARGCTSRLDRL